MSTPVIPPVNAGHAQSYHDREVPPPTVVADGITAIPVPLQASALRSVMIYTIPTSAGLVLIDAGYRHDSCWDAAGRALASVGQRFEDVVAVLLTHNHPDHVGFAHQVREVSGAEVVVHQADDFATQHAERGTFLVQLRAALGRTGAPGPVVEEMFDAASKIARHDEDLVLDRTFTEHSDLVYGDVTIRAIHTPGHTFGHTSYLHPQGALFTGDTLMPEGPTQLAIPAGEGDDPAGDLIATLDRIAGLDAAYACPAHQYPYRKVTTRARALRDLHAGEVQATRRLAAGGASAWEVAPQLTWSKPWAEMGVGTRRFALVHTLALIGPRSA